MQVHHVPTAAAEEEDCGGKNKNGRRGANLLKKRSSRNLLRSFTGGPSSLGDDEEEEDGARSFGSPDDFLSKLGSEIAEDDDDDDGSTARTARSQQSNSGGDDKVPRRWLPRSSSRRAAGRLGSNLLSSFTKRSCGRNAYANNHSSHPVAAVLGGSRLSDLEEEDDRLRPNSDHDGVLTEAIRARGGGDGAAASPSEVARMLRGATGDDAAAGGDCWGCDSSFGSRRSGAASTGIADRAPTASWADHRRRSSTLSELSVGSADAFNAELDMGLDPFMDSNAMLESLGDNPSSRELANIAAVRAKEYIEECLSADVSALDREKWERIPQFAKTDLVVGQHLGKGTFSDAFEVFTTIVEDEASPTLESLGTDRDELDRLIETKFKRCSVVLEAEELSKSLRSDACELDEEVEAMFKRMEGEDETGGVGGDDLLEVALETK